MAVASARHILVDSEAECLDLKAKNKAKTLQSLQKHIQTVLLVKTAEHLASLAQV